MSLQESLDLLAEIEQSFPVNDWSAEGIRLWPLVRTYLSFFSSQPHGGRGHSQGFASRLSRLGMIVDAWVARLRDRRHHLPFAVPAKAFILTYSCTRQVRLSSGHEDTRLGPIVRLLEDRGLSAHVWEFSYVEPYRLPRTSPSHLIQSRLLGIHARHALHPRALGQFQLPRYDEVCDLLRRRGYFYDFLEREALLREFGHILSLRDLYRRALDQIHPDLAFTANVSRYEMALYLACLERGILSVEVQHGVQGDLHGQYARWTCPPAVGYELLPDAYWCWDRQSASTINAWSGACAPRHRAVDGGIPWLDTCGQIDPGTIDPRYEGALTPDPARRVALLTLQPSHLIYTDPTLIPSFVLEAMSRQGRSCDWWIRFHPTMRRNDGALRELLRSRGIQAELDVANGLPLPAVLRRADLHLTHSSSTVLEAEAFGVPSIVWSTYGAGLFPQAVRDGHCRLAETADDLDRALAQVLAAGRYPPPQNPGTASAAMNELFDTAAHLRNRLPARSS